MKIFCIILTSFILFLIKGQDSKQDLFCHRWVEIGYKYYGEKTLQQVNPEVLKTIQFFKGGTFTEESYIEKATGNWIFNSDTTKFGIEYTLYNNQHIGNLMPITTTSLIIKLTEDTLIYGEEGKFGHDKVYGHDDYYFVREY
jgi:hypothetical protein